MVAADCDSPQCVEVPSSDFEGVTPRRDWLLEERLQEELAEVRTCIREQCRTWQSDTHVTVRTLLLGLNPVSCDCLVAATTALTERAQLLERTTESQLAALAAGLEASALRVSAVEHSLEHRVALLEARLEHIASDVVKLVSPPQATNVSICLIILRPCLRTNVSMHARDAALAQGRARL